MAAEKVTNLYYKIIANQEQPPPLTVGMMNGSGGLGNGAQMAGMQDLGFGGAGPAPDSRWYGAIEQAAEAAGTTGTVGSTTNGDVDMDGLLGGWLGDDLWNFTSSELFML